jgi:hypothetical protein
MRVVAAVVLVGAALWGVAGLWRAERWRARGRVLDAFGRDLGLPRVPGEGDGSYRARLREAWWR